MEEIQDALIGQTQCCGQEAKKIILTKKQREQNVKPLDADVGKAGNLGKGFY